MVGGAHSRRAAWLALALVAACGTSKQAVDDGDSGGSGGMGGMGGTTGGSAGKGAAGSDASGGDTSSGGTGGAEAGSGGDTGGGGDTGSGGDSGSGGSGGASGAGGTPSTGGGSGSGGSSGSSSADGGTGAVAGGTAGSGGSAGAEDIPVVTPCSATPPSCEGLPKTCGPTGDGDCCESDLVTGGNYNRDNYEIEPATVATFCLDKYEITVGRFRTFVAAMTGGTPPPGGGKNPNAPNDPGWDPAWDVYAPDDTSSGGVMSSTCSPGRFYTAMPDEYENRPVNCISWYEVYAFCTWDGGWMPTRLEWDYAARGGALQRYLPWSVPATDRSLDGTYASYACKGDGNQDDCNLYLDILDVGSFPKGNGAFGQADLIGNVMEWVKDWNSGTVEVDCNECGDFTGGTRRNLRGGHSESYEQNIGIIAMQTDYMPTQRWGFIGGRCARAP